MLVYILLVLMIIIWSFNFIIVDIAVEYMSPLSVAFYRFLVTSISFLFIDLYMKLSAKKKKTSVANENNVKFSRNDWILLVFSSLTGVLLYFFFQHSSIELIGPSLPALFVCLLSPIIISVLALIFFHEKLNSYKIIGYSIAIVGAFLMVTGGNLNTLNATSPNFLGYIFALLTPLFWAIYSTASKEVTKRHSPMKMLKWVDYLGTLELFILVLINGEFNNFIENCFNITVILCVLYLGIAVNILGYVIWHNSLRDIDSSKAASFLYFEPFLTLIFAFLLQRQETIVLWNILGGIIVLVAVLMINRETKELNSIISNG